MGVSLALSVLYGWGKKGEALIESVSAKRGKNLSVLGALDCIGMVAVATKQGAMTREDFERFLAKDLLPRLEAGCVLVLDNASIHKGGKIEKIVKKAGCQLLYLPPYSPDFNPIELAWAFLKRIIRRCGPRDDAARLQSLREAIKAIPDQFANACFRHCNYTPAL
jgi:transposase